MKDKKVNTLIIGAGRSGTTSLSSILAKQEEVLFSKIKEVHYFSIPDLYKRGDKYYHSFFNMYHGQQVIVSADTYLLIDYEAISRIYAYNPEMKIIAMMRDPVERAYSSYNYSVNYGHHHAYGKFTDSIYKEETVDEDSNIVDRNNLGHFYAGLYHKHLAEWMKVFDREQLLLLETRELKEKPDIVAKKLLSFLSLPEAEIEFARENASAIPKSKRLEKFLLDRDSPLRRIIRKGTPAFLKNWVFNTGVVDRIHDVNRKVQQVPPLSEEEYIESLNYFKNDLELLLKEFGIDLLAK